MLIGHFAAAFAAKRVAPDTSLGTLFVAVQLPDLLWPVFLLTGLESVQIDPGNTAFSPLAFTHYPITHSLVASAAWAAAFALVYLARTRYLRGALLVGLGVLSHWLLDAVVHRPDLPLYPGGATHVGLGLWNSVPATLAVEGLLFVLGVAVYLRATRPRSRAGSYALWSLLALLVLLYAGNVLGPPPEDVRSLALFALSAWLLPLWAVWIDRKRVPLPGTAPRHPTR